VTPATLIDAFALAQGASRTFSVSNLCRKRPSKLTTPVS
jgi:hypothetical protein